MDVTGVGVLQVGAGTGGPRGGQGTEVREATGRGSHCTTGLIEERGLPWEAGGVD